MTATSQQRPRSKSFGDRVRELRERARQEAGLDYQLLRFIIFFLVGIGVRSGAQAAEIGRYADAVIVGAALVSALGESLDAMRALTGELAAGVRASHAPA